MHACARAKKNKNPKTYNNKKCLLPARHKENATKRCVFVAG